MDHSLNERMLRVGVESRSLMWRIYDGHWEMPECFRDRDWGERGKKLLGHFIAADTAAENWRAFYCGRE